MRFFVGGSLVIAGGLVVFGALTGRLPAMLAALVKPGDLSDSVALHLKREGGAVAGSGSTPDVPPPAATLPGAGSKTEAGASTDPTAGLPPIVAPAPVM